MLDTTFKVLERYGNLFVTGLEYTLLLSAISVVLGVIFGTVLALLKMSEKKIFGIRNPLTILADIYIEVIRGTPLLLQLYFFTFLLPKALPQFNLSDFTSVTVALVANCAAYVAEVIRSGIQAVDRGQTEAARTLGMTKVQTMVHIVLPQAVRNILPALCNEFITMIKETSLASTFFIGDLMTQFKTISGAIYLTIEPLMIVGVIYLALTFTLSKLVALIERRMSCSD